MILREKKIIIVPKNHNRNRKPTQFSARNCNPTYYFVPDEQTKMNDD